MKQDIHLSANSLGVETRKWLEHQGFSEDFFDDCKFCAPVTYHATYRGDMKDITDEFWGAITIKLKSDESFDGSLEHERLIRLSWPTQNERQGRSLPNLPIRDCPPDFHKACDVHAGVLLDRSLATAHWLDRLGIPSFSKKKGETTWRIFTATFDQLEAGQRFFAVLESLLPVNRADTLKLQLEAVERFLRYPTGAATLPITYSNQLDEWLKVIS